MKEYHDLTRCPYPVQPFLSLNKHALCSRMFIQNFSNWKYFRIVTPSWNLFLTKYFHMKSKWMKEGSLRYLGSQRYNQCCTAFEQRRECLKWVSQSNMNRKEQLHVNFCLAHGLTHTILLDNFIHEFWKQVLHESYNRLDTRQGIYVNKVNVQVYYSYKDCGYFQQSLYYACIHSRLINVFKNYYTANNICD